MLEIKNLSKKFRDFLAVDNISFSLQKGDILGFLGPNGAGKSTTMRMLSGYTLPTSGTVYINGKDTSNRKTKQLIGYLPETVPLYREMKVIEFLLFVAEIRKINNKKKRVEEILELTFLKDVADQSIGTLSKGYRQRAGFAQAIIHEPPVLILDEPTDGLDPNQKNEIRSIISSISKDKAIILSTHILEEMEAVCNRAIILNKGKIVIDTTPNELLMMSPNYFHIHLFFMEAQPKEIKMSLAKLAGVNEVIDKSPVNFIVVPNKTTKGLLARIINFLEKKKIQIESIATHQSKASEIFRNLTL